MRGHPFLAIGAVFALAGVLTGCTAAVPTVSAGAAGGASGSSAPGGSSASIPPSPGPTQPPASAAVPSSGPSPKPVGLIAVQGYQPGDATLFTNAVYADTTFDGVAPRLDWANMEPSAGDYDWQPTDEVFAQAAASDKFVVLILVPGFGTPAWALQGVATAMFARQYGQGAGQVGLLPMPWDQTYLSRWFAFLQAVADRYGANPAFRMIAAAGPSSVSAEMSLPDGSSDITRWLALGYTSTRYDDAWETVLQAYARIFPRQFVSLALYPGLPIGPNGTRDASQATATPRAILAEGSHGTSRFAVQTSGLTGARTGSDLYDLVSASGSVAVTGFQLATSATNSPGQMGDASNPAHALALSLQLGVAAHVDYLQVYEADVVNPVMQAVLQSIEAQLPTDP